jgi:hypothetical protein
VRVVELTRDMRPFRKGQDAVVPDDMAAQLVKDGDATKSRPFPPPDVAPQVPVGKPTQTVTQKRYMTRKGKRDA